MHAMDRSTWTRQAIPASLVFVILLFAASPLARAANIITFGNNANSCGGAVLCSTNGTTGYLNNGTGQAFDLSTLSQWFQIDPDGVNHLATQTQAEPDGGAGGFLVVNNTGATVTSYSITLSNTFNSGTPSVGSCSGSSGPLCDQFQANKGSLTGTSESLSGPDLYSCTNGTLSGGICSSGAGQAAANFTNVAPATVTYTWSGLSITPGEDFDVSFASWNNDGYTTVAVTPEPASLLLLGTGLLGLCGVVKRRRAA